MIVECLAFQKRIILNILGNGGVISNILYTLLANNFCCKCDADEIVRPFVGPSVPGMSDPTDFECNNVNAVADSEMPPLVDLPVASRTVDELL